MFELSFTTNNDAFADSPELEIEYILHRTARQVRAGSREGNVRDSNGNTVGTWKLAPEEER
jgi:hypothetical protein